MNEAKQKEVIDAWAWIRKNNQSIPDDVLDLMKNAALEKLLQPAPTKLEEENLSAEIYYVLKRNSKDFDISWANQVADEIAKILMQYKNTPTQSQENVWLSEKPVFDKECTFVIANRDGKEALHFNYNVFEIKQLDGEDADGNKAWYWGLVDGEGDEWCTIEDLKADLYMILPPKPAQ